LKKKKQKKDFGEWTKKTAINFYKVIKGLFFAGIIILILKVLFIVLGILSAVGLFNLPDFSGLSVLENVPILWDLLKFIFGGLI